MSNNLPKSGSKLLAVIFTGIVAPLLVDITTKIFRADDATPSRRKTPSQAKEHSYQDRRQTNGDGPGAATAIPVRNEPTEITQVIAQGVGKTPQDALRDAVRVALAQAIAATVNDAAWATHGVALLDDALRNTTSLIRSFRELRSSRRWRIGGNVYEQEVVVEIDSRCLRNRIRALGAS